MCQVNGPSYSVTCDHCDKSMRNTDDICPHCKHNYSGGTMSEQQVLPATPTKARSESWADYWRRAFDERTSQLARERERHQDLLQVVKEIRGEHDRLSAYDRCACWSCIRTDALLADKTEPAPVATPMEEKC